MKWMKAARIWSFALILLLLTLFLAFADIEKTLKAFIGIRWGWAIWVPLLNVANTFIEALRLSVILYPITRRFQVLNSFNSSLICIIGNVMLPLRFGDGARTYYIAKSERINLSSSVSAIMLDRIADFLLFFIMMALTAILHPFPPSVTKMGLAALAIFIFGILAIFALAGLGRHAGRNSAGRIRNRIAEEVGKFMTGLSVMRNAGLLLPILFFSALSWLLRASMVWFMFKALSIELPLVATPITLILLNFGIAVVSTPANLGGFELATVGALQLFSVELEIALGYAVALHALEVAPMVLFGFVFLWAEGFRTREVLRPVKSEQ